MLEKGEMLSGEILFFLLLEVSHRRTEFNVVTLSESFKNGSSREGLPVTLGGILSV